MICSLFIPNMDLLILTKERMLNPTVTCAYYEQVFLADDKMANISLDVHTFIAQNLPKYHFKSSLDYTSLSLRVFSITF